MFLLAWFLVTAGVFADQVDQSEFLKLLQKAEHEAMPQLLEHLFRARKAGVQDMGPVAALTRRAAELHLLAEVVSVVGDKLTNINSVFKSVVFTGNLDAVPLTDAMEHAMGSGISADEIEAARNAVRNILRSTIEQAVDDISMNSSASDAVEFAMYVHCGVKLGLDGSVLDDARSKLEEVTNGNYALANVDFVHQLVPHLGHAQVKVSNAITDWHEAAEEVRKAAETSGSGDEALAIYLEALSFREAVGLPATDNVQSVQLKAGNIIRQRLLAGGIARGNGETYDQHVERLLEQLHVAKFVTLGQTLVDDAWAEAKASASSALDQALSLDMTQGAEVAKDVSRALDNARRAGIPVKNATETIASNVKHALETAVSNMSPSGENTTDDDCTGAQVLASAIAAVRIPELFDKEPEELHLAVQTYQDLIDADFGPDDFTFAECLLDWCEDARCNAPGYLESWREAAAHIRQASQTTDRNPEGRCDTYRDAIQSCSQVGLPKISAYMDVELLSRQCSLSQVIASSAQNISGVGLEKLVGALEHGAAIGISNQELEDGRSQAQLAARTGMNQIGGTGNLDNSIAVARAINLATRAGVSATEIASVKALLHDNCTAQLGPAVSSVQNLNQSTAAAEALGKLIHDCANVMYAENSLEPARAVWRDLIDETLQGDDLDFLWTLVEYSEMVGVIAPEIAVRRWDLRQEINKLLAMDLSNSDAMDVALEALNEAEDLSVSGNDLVSALRDEVQSRAGLALEVASNSENAHVLEVAVEQAVQLGVSSVDLDAGQAVRNAI